MSQMIVERAREIAKRLAGECKECEGRGVFTWERKHFDWRECIEKTEKHFDGRDPCPACARLREIADWCWHEPLRGSFGPCKHCNIKPGPSDSLSTLNEPFTIPALRELLQDLGLWPDFAGWLVKQKVYNNKDGVVLANLITTLTTESLMTEAVESFLMEVVG